METRRQVGINVGKKAKRVRIFGKNQFLVFAAIGLRIEKIVAGTENQ
jgi:hypothetical protein